MPPQANAVVTIPRLESFKYDAPTTLDLFCGAGGITEGFRQAGFECVFATDYMPQAMETFRYNHASTQTHCAKIETLRPEIIRKQLGLRRGELDVLVGGPPCQGFSINAPDRFLEDPRNRLFKEYARFLEAFSPKTFMFENVPGLLSIGDGKVFNLIIKKFESLGYKVSVKILFAAHYGVPQERWRLILLGSKKRLLEHAKPSHHAQGRRNFRGGSTLTYDTLKEGRKSLKKRTSIFEAIGDLPRLSINQGAEIAKYPRSPHSAFSRAMRDGHQTLFNHYAGRLSPQNLQRIKHVPPGGSWRDIPHELLPEGMKTARRSDHTKRYGRMHPDHLAGTVLTKCDPHWGTVILPDQDRALTVREAARLQSFPDRYRFFGPRVSQYEQVGNAVPVLMSRAVACELRKHLCEHYQYSFEALGARLGG